MLDEYETQSVEHAILPLKLGRKIGSGTDTTTFLIDNEPDKVLKVYRRFAARDVAYDRLTTNEESHLVPQVFAHKEIGLLDALLVEKVSPLDREQVSGLSVSETEQALGVALKFGTEYGMVNWEFARPELGLARTMGRELIVLDPVTTTTNTESAQSRHFASAANCGLMCLSQLLSKNPNANRNQRAKVLENCPFFQTFASLVLEKIPHGPTQLVQRVRDYLNDNHDDAADTPDAVGRELCRGLFEMMLASSVSAEDLHNLKQKQNDL